MRRVDNVEKTEHVVFVGLKRLTFFNDLLREQTVAK